MAKKEYDWAAEVAEHRGVMQMKRDDPHDTMLDGVDYQFVAAFDMDEDIDDFLKTHEDRVVKQDQTFINGKLMFFFSVDVSNDIDPEDF